MGDSSPEAATSYHDPLDAGNLEAIVSGRHGAPFDVLGSHVVTVGKRRLWIVRVFRPYADAVSVIPEAPDETLGAQQTHWPESLAMSSTTRNRTLQPGHAARWRRIATRIPPEHSFRERRLVGDERSLCAAAGALGVRPLSAG